jgi:hypothetical protein
MQNKYLESYGVSEHFRNPFLVGSYVSIGPLDQI